MTATPGDTAETWYEKADLPLGVSHIFERYIKPFYRCNIWFVRGRERNLLVDSGLGVVSLVGAFPLLSSAPILAVASHTHFDHIGNHHEFVERACHATEAQVLTSPTPHNTISDRYAEMAMFERLPPQGFAPHSYQVTAAPPTRLIEAGDVIDLGDRSFTVLHVPGHSPGSIALWEVETGMLIAGDTIYDGPLVDDAYHSNVAQYRETLKRLRSLPVQIVHAGHYPSFGRERFRELIDEYLAGRRPMDTPNPDG